MTALGFLKGVGVFLLLVALHFLIRPLIAARVSIDFLVIAIVLASVRVRPGVAAIIGFFTGLITDSLTPLSLGAGALAMSAVASAASWLKAAVFGDNLVAQGIFLGLGKLAFDIMYLVFEGRLAMSDLLIQLLIWSPLSALVTGLTGVLVLATFRISLESRP